MKLGKPFFLTLLIPCSAMAGGSISREEALAAVCSESKALCSAAKDLNLADVGIAVRARSGLRLMPYSFEGATKDGQPLQVEISADDQGQLLLRIR